MSELTINKFEIFDRMMEGVQVIDKNWRYVYLNDTAIKHSKFRREDLINQTLMEAYPGIEKTELFTVLESVFHNNTPQRMLNKFEYPDGTLGYFNLYIEPINEGILILSIDITEQKINEQKIIETNDLLEKKTEDLTIQSELLKKLLEGKSSLIHEIHHRVKNNLQIIISFLHLEADYLNERSVNTVFQSIESKINAMSMVHEMIAYDNDLVCLNLKAFINDFLNYTVTQYNKFDLKLDANISLSNNCVNIDTAIAFGLLINEILTNALKYGCTKGHSSKIALHLSNNEQNRFVLKIGDNGTGIPQEVLKNEKNFLGLSLIQDFVGQLDGDLNRSSDQNGTYYDITFKEIHSLK